MTFLQWRIDGGPEGPRTLPWLLLFSKRVTLFCKRGPASGNLSVSGYTFLLVDVLGSWWL